MEPLKNAFSEDLVRQIATHLSRQLASFDAEAFTASICTGLPGLELKQRSQLITDHLHACLPTDLSLRFSVIRATLHPEEGADFLSPSDDRGLRGWAMLPLSALIGQHARADFDGGLDLLREMTSRFSSEFDVRYFLLEDQARALRRMTGWIGDPNRHVRRLVSEGTRPRLPWAMQLPALIADPAPILPLLAALRDDPEDYVRRSVANNLNDISKDHPDLVAALTTDWLRDAPPLRARLLRHACRSLIKVGHPVVLQAFGILPPELDVLGPLVLTPRIRMGEAVEFSVTVQSTADRAQEVLIDYALHFLRASGKRSAKVFKWKQVKLAPGQSMSLVRLHPIRPISTRQYYAGLQGLSLRINGEDSKVADFMLDL